jgi:hypothetical protein
MIQKKSQAQKRNPVFKPTVKYHTKKGLPVSIKKMKTGNPFLIASAVLKVQSSFAASLVLLAYTPLARHQYC